ncbi:DoxX family protein [Microbulbifer sp. SAOS-129_SWC]|uniref:DoxX family protein n=1 Tax=Microbulbifer sp. SAOS-129_SWC TaxID=3145235 RepID=UPI0032176CE6
MSIFLWILQALLALHTAVGAVWKFSNSEQTLPTLSAIPHSAWLALAGFELLCGLGLIVPAFYKPLVFLVPIAALCIAAEMLLFTLFNVFSGTVNFGQITYWLVVAAICVFIAYGRFSLTPLAGAV